MSTPSSNLILATRQFEQARSLLTTKPVTSTMVERFFLIDEASRLFADREQPLLLGHALKWILARASLPVDPNDLLLGRYDDHVPTPEEEERLQTVWKRSFGPENNPVTCFAGGHLTLAWPILMQKGLPGLLLEAKERLALARTREEGAGHERFLEGMIEIYEALLLYIGRYADAAKAAGRPDLYQTAHALTLGAPSGYREALQLVVFVFTVYYLYAGREVSCLTLGRVDEYLLPFFQNDRKQNRLTLEDAQAFFLDFCCKCSLHLGRGEHQMGDPSQGGHITGWQRNPVFDSPTYILLGGETPDQDPAENPLTLLFAQWIRPELKNPVVIFRYTERQNPEVWNTILDKVRKNASILLYNDRTMMAAMKEYGVEDRDAYDYSIHPCNWPDISYKYRCLWTIGEPIPVTLLRVLNEQDDYASTEEIYEAFAQAYRTLYREGWTRFRSVFAAQEPVFTGRLSFDDCFLEGPMAQARSSMDGGVRYPAAYVLLRNIGTAADMMAALQEVVFEKHLTDLSGMKAAMEANFEGNLPLLAACRQAPKYGTGDDRADCHAERLLNCMLDIIREESEPGPGERRLYPLPTTINDTNHIHQGYALGATPDGRLAHEPLSENLSPTRGYFDSPTALFQSVCRLPFCRIAAGALNVRLQEKLVAGPEGLERLNVLLSTFFSQGGMQVQVSVADTATLRRAQCCPEDYADLRVRITGYSAVFVDMSRNGQEEIIRRDELG